MKVKEEIGNDTGKQTEELQNLESRKLTVS